MHAYTKLVNIDCYVCAILIGLVNFMLPMCISDVILLKILF